MSGRFSEFRGETSVKCQRERRETPYSRLTTQPHATLTSVTLTAYTYPLSALNATRDGRPRRAHESRATERVRESNRERWPERNRESYRKLVEGKPVLCGALVRRHTQLTATRLGPAHEHDERLPVLQCTTDATSNSSSCKRACCSPSLSLSMCFGTHLARRNAQGSCQ